jgi:hypothetical protein
MNNDSSLTFRLPKDLADKFSSVNPEVAKRLRYLMERDLKERERKRAKQPIESEDVTAE